MRVAKKNEAKQWTIGGQCALVAGSQCVMETEVAKHLFCDLQPVSSSSNFRGPEDIHSITERQTHTHRRLPDSQCPERLYREQLPPAIIPLSKVQALFYSLQAKCYRHSSVWQYQKPSLTCAENWYRDHFWTYSYIYNLHLQNDHSGLQELLK